MGIFQRLAEAFGWAKRECTIVVVGLDASGKSTLINYLKPKKLATYEVTPTVGFSEEKFERGKLRFNVVDMAGGGSYRSLWETYSKTADAIIFVVDATDKIRMAVARDELAALLESTIKPAAPAGAGAGAMPAEGGFAAGCPILFFANKKDLPGAMDPADISGLMGLGKLLSGGLPPGANATGGGSTGHGVLKPAPGAASAAAAAGAATAPPRVERPWHIQGSNALTGEGVDVGIEWLAQQLSKPGMPGGPRAAGKK